MVMEYHGGANILLAHFHYCNKGWEPFTLNWDDKKAASRAELNDEQIQFMKRTSRFVKMNGIIAPLSPTFLSLTWVNRNTLQRSSQQYELR
jgi:hypothetical protein